MRAPRSRGCWQQGTPPVWVLQPTQSNQQVLPLSGIAEFDSTGLETQFAPGPTMVYLQYTNFPGYSDGVLACVLQKVYLPVSIDFFNLSQDFAFTMPSAAYATGYLEWQVSNAVLVQLECVPPVASLPGTSATPPVEIAAYGQVASGEASYPVMIQQNQAFVLTAYDTLMNRVVSAQVKATADPSIFARVVPTGAIVAWHGSLTDLPSPAFALCDGSNGTPDLTDKFILAAVGQQSPGPMPAGGDQHTHSMTGFSGTFAASARGAHNHRMPSNWIQRDLDTPDPLLTGSTGASTLRTPIPLP